MAEYRGVEEPPAEMPLLAGVTLHREGDSSRPVLFEGRTESVLREIRWIELGKRLESSPLTPGRYELRATLPGGRSVSRDVTLEPGGRLSLELQFED